MKLSLDEHCDLVELELLTIVVDIFSIKKSKIIKENYIFER